MFSKVAHRAGALAPVLSSALQNRVALAASVRCSSVMKQVETWEKNNQVFYGPERDVKNFPISKMPETNPPAKLGFIPESFFQFFYEKTGVTGPYMFGAGLLTFLLSKELWIVEHGFSEFIAFWIAFSILAKKLGPGLGKYLDKQNEEFVKQNWELPLQQTKAQSSELVEEMEKAIWRQDGQKYLFEAKREHVDLQLEAVYRQRLADAHQAIKRRLDFQVALADTKRNFEQKHMVNWIVDSVVKSITPQQEKESLTKCISDLQALAVKA